MIAIGSDEMPVPTPSCVVDIVNSFTRSSAASRDERDTSTVTTDCHVWIALLCQLIEVTQRQLREATNGTRVRSCGRSCHRPFSSPGRSHERCFVNRLLSCTLLHHLVRSVILHAVSSHESPHDQNATILLVDDTSLPVSVRFVKRTNCWCIRLGLGSTRPSRHVCFCNPSLRRSCGVCSCPFSLCGRSSCKYLFGVFNF